MAGQPVRRGSMAHDHDLYRLLAEAAAQRRDAGALRQYVPHLEALATRDNHRLYLAIAHRAWGVAERVADEHRAAQRRFEQALELLEPLGAAWQIGRTHYELGELHVACSDHHGARHHFSTALDLFEGLKAQPDVERTRAALAALP